MKNPIKRLYSFITMLGIVGFLTLLLITEHGIALQSAPVLAPPPLQAPTAYRLKTHRPDIVSIGTVSEGVSTSGVKTMWKEPNGQIHLLATFGGNGKSGWFGHYINMNTGESTLVGGADKGSINGLVYHPVYNKVYAGTGYATNEASLTEFDPITRTVTKIADKTLKTVIGGIRLGDDNRIYHPALGNRLYSYDPGVGLPNGWKDYGVPDVGADPGSNYNALGIDTTHIYFGLKRANGTWTLAITPVNGTPGWREWEFGNAGDTALSIGLNENHTEHIWTLTRTLGNGSRKYYRLQNGNYTELTPGQAGYSWSGTPPNQFLTGEYHWWNYGPSYCVAAGDESSYHLYASAYNWEPDFTDLFPIRGIHEYSTVKYRKAGVGNWKNSTVNFPGPWVPQKVKCIVAKSDTSLLAVSDGYNAVINLNYSTHKSTYLGPTSFSPYTALKHANGEIYVGGYPNKVFRYDPTRPWTLTSANAAPRLPSDKNKPNPYFIQMTPGDLLHYRHGLDYDFQGTVWIGGNTTRANLNYGNVMWYNPHDGSIGYMFPGWKTAGRHFSNLCAADNRRRVCVADNDGNIWIIDAAAKKVDPVPITPQAGVRAKTYMVEVENDLILGIIISQSGHKLIRFRPSTKQVLTLKDLGVSGTPFGFGDNRYARMNYKLEKGPDGYVWMFVGDSLYRVHPATGNFAKVLDTKHAQLKFASNNKDLLLYDIAGMTDFKYIPNILEAVSTR